ncbi:MAG: hypothetical protein ACM3S4_09785 [Burkholderiales bacterium]
MRAKVVQILLIIIILTGIVLTAVFLGFGPEYVVEFSINNKIALPLNDFAASLDKEGNVHMYGEFYEYLDLSGWNNIISLASGYADIAGIKKDNTVVMAGRNHDTGDVSKWQDIVMVTMTYTITFGLKKDGTVIYTGEYTKGADADVDRMLNEVGMWNDIVYIDAGLRGIAGVRKNGEVVIAALNPLLEQEVKQWTDIKSLSFESNRVIGLKNNHEVVVCEVAPDDTVLTAYPYPEFEGAVKVCTGKDIMACLMPNGKVKIREGLKTMADKTVWEKLIDSFKYSDIENAEKVEDICCSLHYIIAIKSNGEILLE